MIVRFAVAAALGLVVTAGLLYSMHVMIDTGREVVTEREAVRRVDFVRVEDSAAIEPPERKPERPPQPQSRPERPRPELDGDFDSALVVAVTAPVVQSTATVGRGLGVVSDGDYLPVVKVAPVYPTRALARRLEGFVMVEFTVTASGAVKDVAVLESTAAVFEEPAIEAALKFRYKPRIIDGTPVEVVGVRNKILFTLDQSERIAMH